MQVCSPTDTDDKVNLGLGGDVEVTGCTSSALQTDLLLLLGEVPLHVGFCALEDDLALCFLGLDALSVSQVQIISCKQIS